MAKFFKYRYCRCIYVVLSCNRTMLQVGWICFFCAYFPLWLCLLLNMRVLFTSVYSWLLPPSTSNLRDLPFRLNIGTSCTLRIFFCGGCLLQIPRQYLLCYSPENKHMFAEKVSLKWSLFRGHVKFYGVYFIWIVFCHRGTSTLSASKESLKGGTKIQKIRDVGWSMCHITSH